MRIWALMLVGCSICSPGWAEEPELERLQTRVRELEQENQRLREKLQRIAELASLELPPAHDPRTLMLTATGEWKDIDQTTLKFVCLDCITPIWEAAGQPFVPPIILKNSSEGPMTLFQRGPFNEYQVLLHTSGEFWSQWVFQMGHEFIHVLSVTKNQTNPHMWLEESLCEAAALWSLRFLANSWQESPQTRFRNYAHHFAKYADDVIATAAPVLTLKIWHEQNVTKLANKANDYQFNRPVTIRLMELAEEDPRLWGAIPYLNEAPPKNDFAAHLTAWHDRTPPEWQPQVQRIAHLFEIEIPAP